MKEIKKSKILLLSGALGEGHQQAAYAILEAFKVYRPDVDVEVIDFMEWRHPYLHKIGKYFYVICVKNFPSFYGYLFHKTRSDNFISKLFKSFNTFKLNRMVKLLHNTKPTVVVSTFPSAAVAMSVLKSEGMTQLPTVTVITDHTDHRYWIQSNTDRYVVGSNHVRHALMLQGIEDNRISVTGIPIRLSYNQTFDKSQLREQYGLNLSLPTILVMGGGIGMIPEEFITLLRSNKIPYTAKAQFIIVCGHNLKLQQKLNRELKDKKHLVKITGYVDHIHEFMAMSDLLLTKPGGLTTTEALSMGLPMLLYKPLPGQEQDNAEFLTKMGVAIQAKNANGLQTQIIRLIQNKGQLQKMRKKANAYQMKTASMSALDTIMDSQKEHNIEWDHTKKIVYAEV